MMGTISKEVQHCMESFQQKLLMLDESTQLGWGDASNYVHERDMKYGTAEFNVLAGFKHQIEMTAATPSPITFGEHMHTLETMREPSQTLAVTAKPVSSQMWLGSEKPQ
jgi:hypothetical protein